MPSTYSSLKIELIATGEQSGTWGVTTNTNLGTALEEAITGSADVTFTNGNDTTITLTDTNAAQAARNLRLNLTGSSTGAQNLILGSGCQIEKLYLINNTLGHTITVKNTTGTGIAVPAGKTMFVYNNGTNVVDAINYLGSLGVGTLDATTVNATDVNATTVDSTNLEVTNLKAKDGTAAGSIANTTGVVTLNSSVLTTTDINGGTIDGTAIGSASASTGAFTTLNASSTVTFTGLNASQAVFTNASDQLVSNAITGTGSVVMSASPTLTGTLNAAAITASGNIIGNGNWTIGNADTDTITIGASFVTGSVLRSAKAATNTLALAAYDVDGAAYTNLITLTASNTPTLALTSTGVGTINNMSIGATTASTGAFTTLTSNGATTFTAGTASTTTTTGTLVVTGGVGVSGQVTAATLSGNLSSSSVTITGGTINGTSVGASTPSTGAFTSLSASTTLGVTGVATFTAQPIMSSLTASQAVFTDASKGLVSNAITGTGNVVMSASPTLTGTLSAADITASGNIIGNGNWTIGNADTDTITIGASFVTGSVLRSAKVATNTLALAAYDVDGAAYTNLITLTASNTPTLALTSTGVGTINNMSIGATTASTGAFTTLSANSTVTFSGTTANISLGTSQTSGTWTAGGTAQTGAITLGQSTGAQTINIGTGATTNATTKPINIGTSGVSGSTTNITFGSSVAGSISNFTFNGTQAIVVPKGNNTTERPASPVSGMLRYNTTANEFEGYNGTAWASVGGSAISNDTTTASDLYPTFLSATTGTATSIFTSNAKLLYKPSTGEFKAEQLVATNGLIVNSATIATNYTVAAGQNAMSTGPVTVNSGISVTVSSGSRWVVL